MEEMIKHNYDKEYDILVVKFNDDDYEISEEIDGGQIVLDKNKKGDVIGFRIFSASKFIE